MTSFLHLLLVDCSMQYHVDGPSFILTKWYMAVTDVDNIRMVMLCQGEEVLLWRLGW